jgi:hypothetical protein
MPPGGTLTDENTRSAGWGGTLCPPVVPDDVVRCEADVQRREASLSSALPGTKHQNMHLFQQSFEPTYF